MALRFILLGLATVLLCLILLRIIRKLYRFPAPAFIGPLLDSGFRCWLQSPHEVILRSGIKAGMMVLDLGCGSGACTTVAARVVGQMGKVYAVDIQPAMMQQLKRKLSRSENRDINNVELRKASAYDLPFEDGFFDLIYLVTVLPEIPDRGRALREIYRVLKSGGILAISETLSDPDYCLRSTIVETCLREGYLLDASLGNLWSYTVRFTKSS